VWGYSETLQTFWTAIALSLLSGTCAVWFEHLSVLRRATKAKLARGISRVGVAGCCVHNLSIDALRAVGEAAGVVAPRADTDPSRRLFGDPYIHCIAKPYMYTDRNRNGNAFTNKHTVASH
jgi:hypothetical protein